MSGPVEIFIRCWVEAGQWAPSERRILPKAVPSIDAAVQAALKNDSPELSGKELDRILLFAGSDRTARRVTTLQIMRCIDELFQNIHPRTIKLAPALTARLSTGKLPEWLRDARDHRRREGVYGATADRYLIPRGPLSRRPRSEHDSFADSLADRFAYLSVVPYVVQQEDRRIIVKMRVVNSDALQGVPPGLRESGSEVVCAVPVAETRADLEFTQREVDGNAFVLYGPSTAIQPGKRLIDAIDAAAKTANLDIAVAPEFVVPSAAVEQILDILPQLGRSLCRLLVAGSGNAANEASEQPWNEAVALNGIGANIWRQRKVWPASIDPNRAIEFGLSLSGTGNLFEDNSSGDSIEIVDIDSIGRCIILICQDFESSPMASELVRRWQPDWVFVPIMDRGLAVGGWFHQRAMALGRNAHTRFVAVSSVGLPRAGAAGALPCLLISCGINSDGVTPGRAVVVKTAIDGTSPGYAIVDFSTQVWDQTALGVVVAKAAPK